MPWALRFTSPTADPPKKNSYRRSALRRHHAFVADGAMRFPIAAERQHTLRCAVEAFSMRHLASPASLAAAVLLAALIPVACGGSGTGTSAGTSHGGAGSTAGTATNSGGGTASANGGAGG